MVLGIESFGLVFCVGGTHAFEGLTTGLDLKGYSEDPISPARLFEVVADDLLTLNKNLQSVSNAFWDWSFVVFYLVWMICNCYCPILLTLVLLFCLWWVKLPSADQKSIQFLMEGIMRLRHLNDVPSLFCHLTYGFLLSLFLLTFIEFLISILFDNMFFCILIPVF